MSATASITPKLTHHGICPRLAASVVVYAKGKVLDVRRSPRRTPHRLHPWPGARPRIVFVGLVALGVVPLLDPVTRTPAVAVMRGAVVGGEVGWVGQEGSSPLPRSMLRRKPGHAQRVRSIEHRPPLSAVNRQRHVARPQHTLAGSPAWSPSIRGCISLSIASMIDHNYECQSCNG
jgi:hypothetical protein